MMLTTPKKILNNLRPALPSVQDRPSACWRAFVSACENTGEITKFEPAGVVLSQVSGPTSESGDTATFTVVLASQPQSNVVINLASSNTEEGTLDKGTVAFTASDWNISQTVTVTGVDDSVSDGNQP